MRTKILILILIFMFPFSYIYSQQNKTETHFRMTSWGMTQDEVKKLETGEFIKESKSKSTGLNILTYKGQAGALKCVVGYFFAEGQLVEGRYIFYEQHTNKNLYITDFKEVKVQLTEKYGEPSEDKVVWGNDLYRDDPSHHGMAISVGHLAMQITWELPTTKIRLRLIGDNYKISHWLDYKSEIKEHIELAKIAEEKAKKTIW